MGLAWILPASCTLDLGPVLDPKDAGADDANNGDTQLSDGKPDVYELPPGCLNAAAVEAQCDPFTNSGCPGALGCDTTFYTQPRLACLPNDGLQLGDSCNQNEGPYCAGKLTCSGSPGICTRFCCGDPDCTGAGLCIPFDFNLGTLGFCSGPPPDGGADAGDDADPN
jgi:hypothetical protein